MFHSASSATTFIIDTEGGLFGWGKNHEGQIGLGHRNTVPEPTRLLPDVVINRVCSGLQYTIAWDSNGNCYFAGDLGDMESSSWRLFEGLSDLQIVQVGCGSSHALFLDSEGGVWGSGGDSGGQLGLGGRKKTSLIRIPLENHLAVAVACGTQHSFIVDEDQQLWGCGRNNMHQLGLEDTSSVLEWKLIQTFDYLQMICGGSVLSMILLSSGEVLFTGHLGKTVSKQFTLVEEVPLCSKIVVGFAHCFLIDTDDQVWAIGNNHAGQLGVRHHEKTISNPVRVEFLDQCQHLFAGNGYSWAVDVDGHVLLFGYDQNLLVGVQPTCVDSIPPNSVLLPSCKTRIKSATFE